MTAAGRELLADRGDLESGLRRAYRVSLGVGEAVSQL